MQFELHVDTKKAEDRLMQKASSMVWGWIIGGIIFVVVIGVIIGIVIYVAAAAKSSMAGGGAPMMEAPKTAVADTWDGKEPYDCVGAKNVKLSGVTAKWVN